VLRWKAAQHHVLPGGVTPLNSASTAWIAVLLAAPTGCHDDSSMQSTALQEGGGGGGEMNPLTDASGLPSDGPFASNEATQPTMGAEAGVGSSDGSSVGAGPLLGWFTGAGRNDTTVIDAAAAAGANLVVAYAGKDLSQSGVRAFLDHLQGVRMRALLQIDPGWVTAPDTAAIAGFVNAISTHPALYGWYLFDEPEFNNVSPAQLKVAYDAVRAADADHPIAISFGNGYCSYTDRQAPAAPGGATFMTIPEIVMFQQYPVHAQPEFQKTPDGKHGLADIAEMVDDCVKYLALHHSPKFQGLISDLQAFAWSDTDRDPTYRESRYMLFRSLIRNPFGVEQWIEYRASAGVVELTNRLIREASSVGPALRNSTFDDPSVTVSASTVHHSYGSAGGRTYLFATNDGESDATGVLFTLPAGTTAKHVEVLFDRLAPAGGQYTPRELPLGAGSRPTFSDDFGPFEVHLYELAP
jgi:hypothetical protein